MILLGVATSVSAVESQVLPPPPVAAAYQIPSHGDAARKVIESILKWLDAYRWDQQSQFGIHLAAEEAVVNAIKHGNQNDPDKSVRISFLVSARLVRIVVEDQGKGFDPRQVPDPTCGDRLEVPSGRGLFLMRSYMTSVVHNDTGNEVTMELDR